MLANLNLDGGAVLSEAFAGALAPLLGRAQADDFIKASVQRARTQNRSVASVISEATEITGQLSGVDLDRLLDSGQHVGLSAELVDLACTEAEVSLRS
jgi:adenylosuccinate lyase